MSFTEDKDYYEFQPIEGVPVVQIGDRFRPLEAPVEKGETDSGFWFIYEGSKRGKLTIDVDKWTETLEEVE